MDFSFKRAMFQLIKDKNIVRILFFLTVFLILYIYNNSVSTNYKYSREAQMRMAVIGTLGGAAIPIIAQCGTSRNLVEGIYARRSDMPGGYCFHPDCDVLLTPGPISEKIYMFKIQKKGL